MKYFALLVAMLALGGAGAPDTSTERAGCEFGAYRSPSGELAAITPPLAGHTVSRYTMLDGRRGDTDAPDSPLRCVANAFAGTDSSGAPFTWMRLAFRATPSNFTSEGVTIHGLLLEPVSVVKPPLIVFVHGSEKYSPLRLYYQTLFTAQGVSTFFYDKRGTGESGGAYTQDFALLAKDAANAARAARKLAAGRFSRLGFFGGSQGGWVAPLAALASHADFLEVGFGFVGTPIEQDQWQVDYQLQEAGFGAGILPDVHRVTTVTASVAGSGFSDTAGLDAVVKEYSNEPWFGKIDGQYSGDLLKGKIESVRAENAGLNVPWHYSGLGTLQALTIPQLWVFAKNDSVAPSAKSIERLQALKNGAPITIVVFPNTDHGISTYHTAADGSRVPDGNVADGYLRLLGDFAKGTVSKPYGNAEWPPSP